MTYQVVTYSYQLTYKLKFYHKDLRSTLESTFEYRNSVQKETFFQPKEVAGRTCLNLNPAEIIDILKNTNIRCLSLDFKANHYCNPLNDVKYN